ncbi:hypothetical protein [Kitasatospora sp. McL0602]|uniref:hypothetical protein n=1 Tax=Kitasatospora sp. McL0602 TaxID=3439530 RepID=UPI003F8CC2CB
MASNLGPRPADEPDELALPARGVPADQGGAPRNHEELLRRRRAALRHDPAASGAAELSQQVLGWAQALDVGERTLRDAARGVLPEDGRADNRADNLADGRAGSRQALGRAAALLGAAEAAAALAARSAHTLTAESAVTSTVVSALVPALVAELTAELGRPVSDPDVGPDLGPDPEAERRRGAVVAQFPWLVHGFALETVDEGGLAEAVRLGAPLAELDADRLGSLSRGGCSPVQALPKVVSSPALGRASAGAQSLAKAVLSAGDELHRRMAEVPEVPQSTPADRRLAAAYETLYAAAACLALWTARTAPVQGDELWLQAALRGLLGRLHRLLDEQCPDVDEHAVEETLADRVVALAGAGGPLTPFVC